MKNPIFPRWIAGLMAAVLLLGSAFADDLDRLEGKWTSEKKSAEGETVKTALEITKGKFTYRLMDASGGLRIFAKGTVKIEKHGPFNVLRFTDIQGGTNETELQEVGDDRVNPYQLGYNTLTMAGNFDRERDEAPSVDVFKKVPKETKN